MTPFCVRVSRFGDNWQLCEAGVSNESVDTLQLVVESPEFLGMLKPDGPVPRAAMVAPNSSSGRIVIAVDDTGRVMLVACPEESGEAELAGLVGDLLATGGRFWHQSYEVLAEPFEAVLGMKLEEWIGSGAGEKWSVDEFRESLTKSLSQGKFPILVLVSEMEKPIEDMLNYLGNMNLDVTPVGYHYLRGDGLEVITPRVLGGKAAAPAEEAKPERPVYRDEFTPVVPVESDAGAVPSGDYEPFDAGDVTSEQQEILERLVQLDDLGLKRVGMEYFVPGNEQKDEAEGTIVVSVNPDRWPMPESKEVVVVVNTGQDHLAKHLRLSSEEIEEFLSSLPRVTRKEHKGCLLLRAATTHEATQLVNELKALREVALMG